MRSAVGTFTSPAATGTQEVTVSLCGLAPKAVIIWGTQQTAAGVASKVHFSIGFATSATNRAAIACNEDLALTLDDDRYHDITAVIVTTSSVDFSPATVLEKADLDSFSANKFTLDWETVDGAAIRYHYIAIAGADVEANVVQFIAQTVDATSQDVPHGLTGGAPTAFFGISAANIAAPPSSDGAGQMDMTIMASDMTNDQIAGVGAAGGTASRMQLALALGHSQPSGILEKATITAVDATNVTFLWSVADTAEYYYALFLRGVNAEVGTYTSPAAPGNVTITPTGFNPNLFLTWGFMGTNSAVQESDSRLTFGASDGTNHAAGGLLVDSGPGTADKFDSSTNVLAVYDHAQALEETATATIVDADVTVVFGSAVAAANEFNYLILGPPETEVPGAPPDIPIAGPAGTRVEIVAWVPVE